ncbi:MAG TPA: hypothetical protein DFL85_12775 [Lentisphaeria bacterium]|nr:hypothetical protein [Lentisphaeria bacterium]HCH86375.1 hypothetical protein [Lentisphaeria bacterium]
MNAERMRADVKKCLVMIAMAAAVTGFAAGYPNYALNCEVFASSIELPKYPADLAVDGVAATRWSSGKTDDEWITLDLGTPRRIGRIVLNWERSAGMRYAVQLSDDNEHYTDVFTEEDGKLGAYRVIDIRPRTARYVRVDCRERLTDYGFSLWEVEVYPPVQNLAFRCRMSASGALPDNLPPLASDGMAGTGWIVAAGTKPQWIMLELGSVRTAGKIVLNWGKTAAKKYTVEISEDGKNFSSVYKQADGKAGETKTITFAPKRFGFVRVTCEEPAAGEEYGLDEIEVYAK